MLKKNDSVIDMETYIDKESAEISDEAFESVSAKVLTDNILKLPQMYRDILYLHHLYGYSFGEISAMLSLPIKTAKKRAQRARSILKEMLKKEGYYHE